MATTSQIVTNILGGVSQQPESTRLPSQCREAINCYFSPTDGMGKRWPLDHVSSVSGSTLSNRRLFTMDREDEQYLVLLGQGEALAWTKDGTVVPVHDSTNSAGSYAVRATTLDYIGDGTPNPGGRDDLRVQVVVDTAFVVNKNVIVAETTGATRASWDTVERSAGVFIRQMNWNTQVKVTFQVAGFDEYTVEYSTPSNDIYEATINGSGFVQTTTALVAYDAVREGWVIERDGAPYVTNSKSLFAHPTAGVVRGSAQFGAGDLQYDVATRLAKDLSGSYTGSLSFGRTVDSSRGDYQALPSNQSTPLTASQGFWLNTEYACQVLKEKILDIGPGLTGITDIDPGENESGSSMLLRASSDFLKFEVEDSVGNTYATGWTTEVEDITDLPVVFRHGALVRISGATGDSTDDYWVRFETEKWARAEDFNYDNFSSYESEFGPGQWREAAKPITGEGKLDPSTMPVVMIRSQDDGAGTVTGTPDQIYFDLRMWTDDGTTSGNSEWGDRTTGDDESAPAPSFVGNTINDVFFWQGRLGFVSDSNVILSQTGVLGNFWPTTVLSVPDSDPIDVASTEDQGNILQFAIPLDERLLCFSEQSQVVLTSPTGVLSPATAEFPVISRFEALVNAEPTLVGQTVFFPFRNTNFVGLREMLPLGEADQIGTLDVTQAIPRYIPVGSSHRLKGSAVDNLLVFHSDADPSTLYVFKYLKSTQAEYVMSAWGKWTLNGSVLDFDFLNDRLYVLVGHDNDTCIESMEIGPGQADDESNLLFYVDRKYVWDGVSADVTASYDTATNETTLVLAGSTMPNLDDDSALEIIEAPDVSESNEGGKQLTIISRTPATNTIVVRGDYRSTRLIFGEPYTMEWRANQIFEKVPNSRGGLASSNREATDIRSVQVSFERTGFFEVETQYKSGDTFTTAFHGGPLGTLGVSLEDDFDETDRQRRGVLPVPINAKTGDHRVAIKNDSPYASNIVQLEWDIRHRRKYGARLAY